MHMAAMSLAVGVTRCLLQAGADKAKAENHGQAAMHMAAMSLAVGVTRCLLQAGADKAKAENHGQTVMHVAAMNGHGGGHEIVRRLLAPPSVSGKSKPEHADSPDKHRRQKPYTVFCGVV